MHGMIVSLEPKEFVSCGQQAYSQHPGLLCLHFNQANNLNSTQSTLLGTFSQVTLNDRTENADIWQMRMYNGLEEELYLSGNTVIWSREHVVLKTFTVDSAVKQAVWCKFSVNGEDPHQFDLPKPKSYAAVEGVSVVADGTLHVFSEDGDNFVTSLPFQVRDVWNFKYGLLFERMNLSNGKSKVSGNGGLTDNDLTTIFCLQHPLREFSPIILKNHGIVRYMNRSHVTVVHCQDDFIMTCDERHGLHTIWKARQVCLNDINALQPAKPQQQQHQISSLCHMSLSSPGLSPYRGGSYRGSPIGYNSSNMGQSGHMQISGLNKTPLANRGNPSLAHLSYTPHSSKAFSPGSMLLQSNTFSPLRHSPHLTRSPCTPLSHESLCLNNSIHEAAEPLRPELCFEHMWTESLSSTREGLSVGKATKVFQTADLCNQTYLAYHIDGLSQLRVVRYSQSNDRTQLIFGAVTCLPARDAAALVDHNMFAILDLNGFLVLHSGYCKVVKINVSGLPLASLNMSHGLHTNTSVPVTPQPISTPAHPSRPTSAMGSLDEVGLLSPVPELAYSGDGISILTSDEFAYSATPFTSRLTGIPHVVGPTMILEVTGGKMYRVNIPAMCSSDLVKLCLKALRYTLPNDNYLTFAVKWYSSRHAPGALNGSKMEWSLFVDCLMEYLGYTGMGMFSLHQTACGESMNFDMSASPAVAAKKSRPTEKCDSKDWDYLLESSYHQQSIDFKSSGDGYVDTIFSYNMGSMGHSITKRKSMDGSLLGDSIHLNNNVLLPVFSCLHLVYEEQKLNQLTWHNVTLMSPLLFRFAQDLNQYKFLYTYALDNPSLMPMYLFSKAMEEDTSTHEEDLGLRMPGSFSSKLDPSVFENLDEIVRVGSCKSPLPYIPGVTVRIETVLKVWECLFNHSDEPNITVFAPLMKTTFNLSQCCNDQTDQILKASDKRREERVLSFLVAAGVNRDSLSTWPGALSMAVYNALDVCSANPDISLSSEALELLGRTDLVAQIQPNAGDWKHAKLCPSTDPMRSAWQESGNGPHEDQHEEDQELLDLLKVDDNTLSEENGHTVAPTTDDNVTRLLFHADHRMADAHNLLQSTKPAKIFLQQQIRIDDREYMEQKQYRLVQLLNRTLALSVGRGMLHYRSQVPSSTDTVDVPPLDLTGKDVDNSTITLANSETELPSETVEWPYFHNGVAAALSLCPTQKKSWLQAKAPRSDSNAESAAVEPSTDHAGVLLGLGLNNHLQDLQTLNVHDYLQKIHEPTTIGLLLGLASDKCGSCDLSTMRVLSVHISALLPATSTQLDIPFRVQTAAVTAVGFLYMGSSQRLVAEVMLKEIDRTPSSDSEVCTERESYALSAGFALGLVTLGMGDGMPELSDLNMSDQLFYYMTGKHKRNRTVVHWSHEAYSPSQNTGSYSEHQILEGDHVNTEVTGPGATVALALMYLKTNNSAVADWFIAPNTINLLESIKPQQLLLRTMSRAIILWDQIMPSVEWVESHIPSVISSHLTESGLMTSAGDGEFDEHTILQCHSSIIAGACVALGLRYAGSQEKTAYTTLLHFVNFFLSLSNQSQLDNPLNPLEVIGRRLFDTCLSSCLIALCMVVAGSGNLKALQICRFLHYSTEGEVNYGTQMAVHMGLGFLFLGKCRYTLSTTDKAVAALLISIYPCFPAKSCDNRYHLQALRHMYAMAAENRLLIPIDVSHQRPCYARVNIKYLPTHKHSGVSIKSMAPCMLPEADFLQSVYVEDERYWPMHIDVQKHPKKLEDVLNNGIYVKLKSGCLSYIQDPKGYCSFLSHPESSIKITHCCRPSVLHENIQKLLAQLCHGDVNETNVTMSRMVSLSTEIQSSTLFFVYLGLFETCCGMDRSHSSTLSMWQIRLASSLLEKSSDKVQKALIAVIRTRLAENFENQTSEHLKHTLLTLLGTKKPEQYLDNEKNFLDMQRTSCYLVYNNVSHTVTSNIRRNKLGPSDQTSAPRNLHECLLYLKQLNGLPKEIRLQIWKTLCLN